MATDRDIQAVDDIIKGRTLEEKPKQKGTNKYKAYPYTFSRPNETVRAVIRLYNDMSVKEQVIEWLLEEFNTLNADQIPPKLGATVLIPVLLPFTWRHDKERSIWNEDKEKTKYKEELGKGAVERTD